MISFSSLIYEFILHSKWGKTLRQTYYKYITAEISINQHQYWQSDINCWFSVMKGYLMTFTLMVYCNIIMVETAISSFPEIELDLRSHLYWKTHYSIRQETVHPFYECFLDEKKSTFSAWGCTECLQEEKGCICI